MEHIVRSLISIAGIPFALFIFLAPLSTIIRIINKRSTEHFSVVPYLVTLLSCLISAWYGVLLASPETIPVPTICGIGAALESAYVIIFIIYARTRKDRANTLGLLALVLVAFTILALVPLFALDGDDRRTFCSVAAGAIAIAMYASPMTVMSRVLRTKSTEFMPTYVSLSMFLYATWANIFSLRVKDYARFAIVVSYGSGYLLGGMQLAGYALAINVT